MLAKSNNPASTYLHLYVVECAENIQYTDKYEMLYSSEIFLISGLLL